MVPIRRHARSARCERHGVLYDAERYSGCVFCRMPEPEPPSRRWSPIGIATWLVLISVVFLGLGNLVRQVADTGEEVLAQAHATPNRIDPAQYRQQIEELEAVVYADADAVVGRRSRIQVAAMQLGQAVMRGPNRPLGAKYGQRILAYGQRVGVVEDIGYQTVDLVAARAEWETLRGDVFLEADWFDYATTELGAREPAARAPVNANVMLALDDWALELERLVRSGRRDALVFGEPGVDVPLGSREEAQLQRAWAGFQASWSQRLEDAVRVAPQRRPMRGENDVAMVYEHLERATRELASLGANGGFGSVMLKYVRQSHLDVAAQEVDEARRLLAKVSP